MRGVFMSVGITNAEFHLPGTITAFAHGRVAEHGAIHQLCTLFRQRGLCQLLRSGVSRGWQLAAMQSASALAWALERWPEATKVTSHANPLLDALACGYWQGAADIAARSRMSWNPDREYEDDFLYVRFLLEFVVARDLPAARASLERYAEVLEGPPDARLEICTALIERDVAAFDEGLVRLLDERDDRIQQLILDDIITDEPARWLEHVSVEGLALLAIAAREGLETAAHHLHCPSVARVVSPFAYNPDAWRTLDVSPL